MRDEQDNPLRCLKIGYAKNIEDRLKAYRTYNPSVKLLKTREGDYELENYFHRCFNKYKLPNFNEWFVYKKEIIDKFDTLDLLEETITREEYLEYIRKEIITNIIPEVYKDLKSQIPDLLDELKREFDNNYNDIYSSLYTEFPENECKEIIIRAFKFLRELEIDFFTNYTFSSISDRFPEKIFRQRLKENVFRDECIFIYKLSDEKITMEEYDSLSKQKLKMTEQDIRNYNAVITIEGIDGASRLISDYRSRVKFYKYSGDYTGIDEKTGQPKINKLVMISERRAFELRCNTYKSDVQVYNEFMNTPVGLSDKELLERSTQLNILRSIYKSNGSFESKMKSVCEFLLNPKYYGSVHVSDLYWLPLNQRNYILLLGPEKLRSLSYIEAAIKRELENNLISEGSDLRNLLLEDFTVGERYPLKEIKTKLSEHYLKLGLMKTAKASDLEDYFEVKKCTIYPKDGKKTNGYEIISLKE